MNEQLKAALKDPLVIISALIAVLSAIAQGTLPLPIDIPGHVAASLRSWDGFVVGCWLLATPVLFGMKTPVPPKV